MNPDSPKAFIADDDSGQSGVNSKDFDPRKLRIYDKGSAVEITGDMDYGIFKVARIKPKGVTLVPEKPKHINLISIGETVLMAGGYYKVCKIDRRFLVVKPKGRTTKKLYADAFK